MKIELRPELNRIVVSDTQGERTLFACGGEQTTARALFGGNVWEGDWSPRHQEMAMGLETRRFLGWAWKLSYVPQWSMEGWDLRLANLCGADLRGANLREADLRGASLVEARLSRVDLIAADLRRADLRRAILPAALLSGAKLEGALLEGAYFLGAILSKAQAELARSLGAVNVPEGVE